MCLVNGSTHFYFPQHGEKFRWGNLTDRPIAEKRKHVFVDALHHILGVTFRPGGLLVFVPFPRYELKGGLDASGLDLLFH